MSKLYEMKPDELLQCLFMKIFIEEMEQNGGEAYGPQLMAFRKTMENIGVTEDSTEIKDAVINRMK